VFEANLTPELRAKAHYSFDGFDAGFHKKVTRTGLAFPAWPKEYGGREAGAASALAVAAVWDEYGWTTHALALTNQVAHMMMRFGGETLKRDVLSRVVSGEATCSLGFSEPHSGSDVFAAKLKATRDGDEWVIDGQKMFTSGAEHSDYVMVLARTNPDVPKHKGLTLFIVPLKAPGVEVQAVHTFQEERTNQTFYSAVRIPDSYRLGDVDGGVKVMATALEIEQAGGGAFVRTHLRLLAEAVAYARETKRNGRPLIEGELVRTRLARVAAHATLSDLIMRYTVWCRATKVPPNAHSSMTKLFASEYLHIDSADMLDLCGAGALLSRSTLGELNLHWRHSHVCRIYGGTSEIHRSLIAERRLGLPRSRS
jgi:3-oxochol-4-en-24-oyl-CoA dehydrogenase